MAETKLVIDASQDNPTARRVGRSVGRAVFTMMILFSMPFLLVGIMMIFMSFFTVEETVRTSGTSYSSSTVSNADADETFFSLNTFVMGLGFLAFGAVPTSIGVAGLIRIRKAHRSEDYDGDGAGGDLNRATEEQMQMIEAGFRDLGQFYKRPRKNPTKMEARSTLREIQSQLDARKNKPTAA